MDGDGRRRDPTGARTALRIVREAFALTNGKRRSLLLLAVLLIFEVNLLTTAIWAKMASSSGAPAANFHAIRPFYEIEDNSTKSAAAGDGEAKEASPFWKLELIGELFWDVSTVMAIFFFSKICDLQGEGQHRRGRRSSSLWRECESLALAVVVWEILSYFVLITLQANGLEDLSRKFDAIFSSGSLLTAVVVSREDVHGFRAIERAWEIACLKLKDVSVIGVMILLMRAALDLVYLLVLKYHHLVYDQHHVVAALSHQHHPKEEILKFSLVAALLHVVMQSFECLMILALYRDSNRQDGNDPDTQVHEIKNGIQKDIKTIKKLTRMLVKHAARDSTVQIFAAEVLEHCDRALQHVQRMRQTTDNREE